MHMLELLTLSVSAMLKSIEVVQLFHFSPLQLTYLYFYLVGGYFLLAMASPCVNENQLIFEMEKIWKKYLLEGRITQV